MRLIDIIILVNGNNYLNRYFNFGVWPYSLFIASPGFSFLYCNSTLLTAAHHHLEIMTLAHFSAKPWHLLYFQKRKSIRTFFKKITWKDIRNTCKSPISTDLLGILHSHNIPNFHITFFGMPILINKQRRKEVSCPLPPKTICYVLNDWKSSWWFGRVFKWSGRNSRGSSS